MPFVSRERLSMGHCLMAGNTPKAFRDNTLNYEDHIAKHAKYDFDKFGWFDTSSPNFNQFYPDVKPEDLVPDNGDFIHPIFRALSEIIVRPNYPIDFTKPGVLKNSMPLLVGQAIYPNHEMVTGDELGVVADVTWGKAKEVQAHNGAVNVPAGMNATFKIDGKSNPRIARAINMDPPSIHSVSVTVEFEWEQSHDMDRDEFWSKLGTYDENGELIRRVVTNINRYHEISLVPHGADPFAQKINADGDITNPGFANATYKFSETGNTIFVDQENADRFSFGHSFKNYSNERFREDTIPRTNNNNNHNPKNPEVMFDKFKAKLKEQYPDLSDAALEEKAMLMLAERDTNAAKVTELEEEVSGLKTTNQEQAEKITSLESDLETSKQEATSFKETSEKALSDTRNEATRLYKLAMVNNTDESMINLIAQADYSAAKAFQDQYAKIVEEKFKQDDGNGGQDDNQGSGTESHADSIESATELIFKQKTAVNVGRIHGQSKQ